MIVATGPYAPSDGLDYSPLTDLINYINIDKPDLCILASFQLYSSVNKEDIRRLPFDSICIGESYSRFILKRGLPILDDKNLE